MNSKTAMSIKFPVWLAVLMSVTALVIAGLGLTAAVVTYQRHHAIEAEIVAQTEALSTAEATQEHLKETRQSAATAAEERRAVFETDQSYVERGYDVWEHGVYWRWLSDAEMDNLSETDKRACGSKGCGSIYVVLHEGCPGTLSGAVEFVDVAGNFVENAKANAYGVKSDTDQLLIFPAGNDISHRYSLTSLECR